ncbi:DEAD/DEAH box helicase [Paenibacillus sp. RS8]|uniref:DEAD/DEAH box helicase n=1 Tax=Paenibacillus sp. RS8 TaxID=3242681 RepID=UPI0035C072C9
MYFESTFAHIEGNPNLREPQVQGYLRVKEYFESPVDHKPALVTLPTGVGKTGLMAILPYGIAKHRVLIVTPNRTIRNTVTDSLDPRYEHNFWWNRKVINIPTNLPEVIEYEGDPRTLEQAKIVITNIHRLQSHNASSLLHKVPRDFFDMIIIDEAHHSPAASWVEMEEYFNSAKIIKITGTPFRSDKKEIYAEDIYSYPLSRAMIKGYVKQLVKKEYIPDQLTFKVQGFDEDVTLEEVLKLKDSDWVERTVAYSTQCSEAVVQRSLRIMTEKREATGVPHKIIAVACSIEHAREIKQLYEAAGCPASIIHSDMEPADQDRERVDFHNDRTHVIVNVGMLGEGYDHPYISIASIFRPFKSLSAYAQFAGRALRSIPDAKDPSIDNVAHLVYHNALGLEELWEYYSKEQQKAEIIDRLERFFEENEGGGSSEGNGGSELDVGEARQSETFREELKTFVGDETILEAYEEAIRQSRSKTEEALDALRSKGIPITDEMIKLIEGSTFEDIAKSKRPDLELKERRQELKSYIENGIAEILTAKGLNPKGKAEDTATKLGYYRDTQLALDGLCVKIINEQLLKAIGYPRKQWSIADFKQARPQAEKYVAYLAERL